MDTRPGPDHAALELPGHLGARLTTAHPRTPKGWPPGTPPGTTVEEGVRPASTSSPRPDSHRRQTRSCTLHGSAGSSATAA